MARIDIVFTLLIIIMICILALTYTFNTPRRTRSLTDVMLELMEHDPRTVSFSLGRNTKTAADDHEHAYRNVYMDKDGNAVEKEERWPVNRYGDLIRPQGQGYVTEKLGGYTISGMDTIMFDCPPGFGQKNCTLDPLCTDLDHRMERLKPLTYAQFNALNLYHNDFDSSPVIKTRLTEDDAPEYDDDTRMHPRIRIHCHRHGNYTLEPCPNNALLDERTLQCNPYDICQDRLSGYKHNYRIKESDPPLEPQQYYLCENNKSVLRVCEDTTPNSGENTTGSTKLESVMFSMANQGCVVKSMCYGMGDKRFIRDDNTYVQCANDMGTLVHCEHGVERSSDGSTMNCIVQLCKPRVMTFDNDLLHYAYGAVECPDGEGGAPVEKRCDGTRGVHSVQERWFETFDAYELQDWPEQIYDEKSKACITIANDRDIIKPGASLNVKWSPLMPDYHPYDLREGVFICDEATTLYRLDYRTGNTVPSLPLERSPPQAYLEFAYPCYDTEPRINAKMPWQGFDAIDFTDGSVSDSLPAFFFVLTDINERVPHVNVGGIDMTTLPFYPLWPYYDPETDRYIGSTLRFSENFTHIICERYEDPIPPLGFIRDPDYEQHSSSDEKPITNADGTVTVPNYLRLYLVGFGRPAWTSRTFDSRIPYVFASGEIDRIRYNVDVSSAVCTLSRTVNTESFGTDGITYRFYVNPNNFESYQQTYTVLEQKIEFRSKDVLFGDLIVPYSIYGLDITRTIEKRPDPEYVSDGSSERPTIDTIVLRFRYAASFLNNSPVVHEGSDLTFILP